MSIYELHILLDLHPESKENVLKKCTNLYKYGYFFVDSDNGQCHMFDMLGNERDVSLPDEDTVDLILRDLSKVKEVKKIVIPKTVCTYWKRRMQNGVN